MGKGDERATIDSDVLRRRAATALERALDNVDAAGDEFSRLRARALLQVRPVSEVRAWIAERQDASGGVAPLGLADGGALGFAELASAGQPRELRGIGEALSVLGDHASLRSPIVEAASSHLAAMQLADGSWGDGSSDPSERLFLTGILGGLLARTPSARPELLSGASRFLTELWQPKRVVEGNWSTLAGMLIHFANSGGEDAEGVVSWCGRELERSFRVGRFAALPTVRVLMYCSASVLPGAKLESSELLAALLDEQREDGSFSPGEAEGRAPETDAAVCSALTVDGMAALLALCSQL
jgi:hypothetical protein